MPRALIFGISGQDGAYLAQLLLGKGYQVFGTSRDAELNGFANLRRLGIREGVTCLSAVPHDFRSALTAIDRAAPDEIYNLSGQSSVGLSFHQPAETHESISGSTLNLLECLRYLGRPVRFYNAASSECFGNTAGKAANEMTPFRPRSPYAVAKAAAFWQVANYREAYGLFACSGILFNHESPLRPARFVTRKIVAAAQRIAAGDAGPLRLGNVEIVRDWGWAPEYVDAMWRMLQADAADDYVVATGRSHSLRELTAGVFAALDLDWQDHVQIDQALLRPTDLRESHANPTKAAERLGWRAEYSLSDIIRAMVAAEGNPAEDGA